MTNTVQAQRQATVERAAAASHELQTAAALLGVDWRALVRCLVKEVGLVKLIRALAQGGDFWAVLGEVDWAAILDCALSAGGVNGQGGDFS